MTTAARPTHVFAAPVAGAPRAAAWVVGALQENTYLVTDPSTGASALIDPGAEGDMLVASIRALEASDGLRLEAVWLTHAHLDHIGALAEVTAAWPVPVYLHPGDQPVFDLAPRAAAAYGLPWEPQPRPGHALADGQRLTLGNLRFTVMHAPGHAPGHVVFHGHGAAFVGDCLFHGSVGRVDLPLSNPRDLSRSLEKIAALPSETRVFPGHGPATSIGREVATNPFLNGGARVLGG